MSPRTSFAGWTNGSVIASAAVSMPRQDADISMDDDGDYFTWTLDETRAVLTEEEAQVAALHYDINEIGEMHHNPAKNVLYVRASIEEIAHRTNL